MTKIPGHILPQRLCGNCIRKLGWKNLLLVGLLCVAALCILTHTAHQYAENNDYSHVISLFKLSHIITRVNNSANSDVENVVAIANKASVLGDVKTTMENNLAIPQFANGEKLGEERNNRKNSHYPTSKEIQEIVRKHENKLRRFQGPTSKEMGKDSNKL